MVTFIEDNPMLWDKKLADYKRADKKTRLWEEQAEKMGENSCAPHRLVQGPAGRVGQDRQEDEEWRTTLRVHRE